MPAYLMNVSLAMTVLDEEDHLERLFESILGQTRLPDEIVVCDGGSCDATLDLLSHYAGKFKTFELIQKPGCNISTGRNTAIQKSSGDIVAITDSGVWLNQDWLEILVEPFESAVASGVIPPAFVSGFYRPDVKSPFEFSMAAAAIPEWHEIAKSGKNYTPSNRSVAYLRTAWALVGGYPEWLNYSEDVLFDKKILKEFGSIVNRPLAIVNYKPRPTLRKHYRQYFNYAAGDGMAGLFSHVHFIRFFAYFVGVPLGLCATFLVSPWILNFGAIAFLAYLVLPTRRLASRWGNLGVWQRVEALAYIPLIKIVGDIGKMRGFLVGLFHRIEHS